ncbi:uncharacterized protein LOC112344161 [Selaginella moellendorffii]|uniref:uncharacterized protein LOC112344161 n=1 Tax=Selaginella moellendorffii TaxID=88036 RepID=UPI000D1D0F85|nr:uncharacterized protein LOC112344161 [Selaginella moellendorffii]|eukprot:XP_024524203.1 uncharacterized protein LOC112344161 [Selaginella moellendorffii]
MQSSRDDHAKTSTSFDQVCLSRSLPSLTRGRGRQVVFPGINRAGKRARATSRGREVSMRSLQLEALPRLEGHKEPLPTEVDPLYDESSQVPGLVVILASTLEALEVDIPVYKLVLAASASSKQDIGEHSHAAKQVAGQHHPPASPIPIHKRMDALKLVEEVRGQHQELLHRLAAPCRCLLLKEPLHIRISLAHQLGQLGPDCPGIRVEVLPSAARDCHCNLTAGMKQACDLWPARLHKKLV